MIIGGGMAYTFLKIKAARLCRTFFMSQQTFDVNCRMQAAQQGIHTGNSQALAGQHAHR